MSKGTPGCAWSGEISINWSLPQPNGTGVVSSIEELASRIPALVEIITSKKSNGFTDDSIVIKISSADSPDLTIIDLPGIVRTTTKGQGNDVVGQVNGMIDRYIAMPNTLILAVVPCNQDIATVDILERAAKIDPQGARTIGVLTKPDLIGPGGEDEVVQVLLNVRKPLKLGYIMVKNFSQKDNNEGKPLSVGRHEEQQYFEKHPVFSQYADRKVLGVDNLVQSLTKLLVSHIKTTIPQMLQDVKRLLANAKVELSQLGSALPVGSREQQSLLVKKISEYSQVLRHSTKGEYRDSGGVLAANEDFRLHYMMQNAYKDMQGKIQVLRPVASLNSEMFTRLKEEMTTQRGRELPGFINTQVFYAFIIELVEAWRPLVELCKAEVVQNTSRVASLLSHHLMREFPELMSAIQSITSKIIEETADEVTTKIEALVLREQDPFTTQDVLLEVVNGIRFRTFENVLRQVVDTTDVKSMGDNLNAMREDIRKRLGGWYIHRHGVDSDGNQQEMVTLIQAYWDIASRRLIDNVCMCIEMEFATKFVTELQSQTVLYGIALQDSEIAVLLKEDSALAGKRQHTKERIQILEKSLDVLLATANDQNIAIV